MEPTATVAATLDQVIDRLARLEPTPLPVISLYLNLQADQHGKDNYQRFLRRELPARARAYPSGSDARASIDKDIERIDQYLGNHLPASANGLALFACAGMDGFFEAVSLDAPVPNHRVTIAPEPHLYPLERLLDEHPPHAVVLADGQVARIFVFALGEMVRNTRVEAREKIKRVSTGGWSQMRFQRHVEEVQAEHARELVAALDRIVREERIDRIILVGDEVNVPLIKGELTTELAAKVIDELKLEARTPSHEIMRAAAEALRRHDAKTDIEAVEQVMGDYLAGGLGAAGADEVRLALERGQVSELLLTASDTGGDDGAADALVAKARQTSARVRVIQDPALLERVGGVAASLRYRIDLPNGNEAATA
jgi:peptide subunit release factor 1 (eRF1)